MSKFKRQTGHDGIPVMVQEVWSDDAATQSEATTQYRKLLSISINAVLIFNLQCNTYHLCGYG